VNPTESRRRGSLILPWALTALYAAGIFVISSIPGDDLPQIRISDKLSHALVFGGLAVLTCRALRFQNPTWSGRAVGGLAVLTTFAYGCLDEVHQAFVSGRQSELADALADGLGAVVASWGWNKAKLGNWNRT
jgi:VanZ family protein